MIHVCYGLYDRDGKYSKFCGTSMVSIFENTNQDVTIHLLHDETLTNDNRDKFNQLVGRYNQQIKFYNLRERVGNKIEMLNEIFPHIAKAYYSIGSIYRLFIQEILPLEIEKVFYFDSGDTMIHCDLNDYWKIDIKNYPLAATTSIENLCVPSKDGIKLVLDGILNDEDYFSSGQMIMNLKFIRQHAKVLNHAINFFFHHKEYEVYDMEILNFCFGKNYLKLPRNFGCYVNKERTRNPEDRLKKGIFHFPGIKPNFDLNDYYNRLYANYFSKTPFCVIENIFRAVDRNYNNSKKMLLHMMKILSGRQRAFFTERLNFDFVKRVFQIEDYEELLENTPPPLRPSKFIALNES